MEGRRCKTYAIDLRQGPSGDVIRRSVRRRLAAMMYSGNCMGILVATPCTSYSVARRPAVRSSEFPMGLPTLNERDRIRVQAANFVTQCTVWLLALASRLGIPWVLENPQSSLLWKVPAIQQLSRRARTEDTLLHQCQFGTPYNKASVLRSSGMVAMWKMERICFPVAKL